MKTKIHGTEILRGSLVGSSQNTKMKSSEVSINTANHIGHPPFFERDTLPPSSMTRASPPRPPTHPNSLGGAPVNQMEEKSKHYGPNHVSGISLASRENFNDIIPPPQSLPGCDPNTDLIFALAVSRGVDPDLLREAVQKLEKADRKDSMDKNGGTPENQGSNERKRNMKRKHRLDDAHRPKKRKKPKANAEPYCAHIGVSWSKTQNKWVVAVKGCKVQRFDYEDLKMAKALADKYRSSKKKQNKGNEGKKTSFFRGVSWIKKRKVWQGCVESKGKRWYTDLVSFNDETAVARDLNKICRQLDIAPRIPESAFLEFQKHQQSQ